MGHRQAREGYGTLRVFQQPARRAGWSRARGSSVLLVVGATAALATLAALLLTASLTAYESAALRLDGTQARLLAEAGLLEVGRALSSGELVVAEGSALPVVWTGQLPQAPTGFRPLAASPEPEPDAAPGGGCGYQVTLTVVAGPNGPQHAWPTTAEEPGPLLVDALATGWCGRGRSEIRARFAIEPERPARRLH